MDCEMPTKKELYDALQVVYKSGVKSQGAIAHDIGINIITLRRFIADEDYNMSNMSFNRIANYVQRIRGQQ